MTDTQTELRTQSPPAPPPADPFTWSGHRKLHSQIKRPYRRFIGLAAAATNARMDQWHSAGRSLFIPNTDLTWLVVRDLPQVPGGAGFGPSRHVASIGRAELHCGLPRLAADRPESSCDLRLHVDDDALLADQFSRVLCRLEWALTAAEVSSMNRGLRDQLTAALQLSPARKHFLYGDRRAAVLPPPKRWFPLPYLGVPAAGGPDLFDRCCRSPAGAACDPPGLVSGVLRALERGKLAVNLDSPLRAGVVPLASEPMALPADWGRASDHDRWTRLLPALLGEHFTPLKRLWFHRQARTLREGFVHLPAALTGGNLDAQEIYWDVGPALDSGCFHEGIDAFLFPPLAHHDPAQTLLRLPGETVLNVAPPRS